MLELYIFTYIILGSIFDKLAQESKAYFVGQIYQKSVVV